METQTEVVEQTDLRQELDELDFYTPEPTEATGQESQAEVNQDNEQVQESTPDKIDGNGEPTGQQTEQQIEPDLKAEYERLRQHKENLNRALHEERQRRKDALAELAIARASLQARQEQPDGSEVDPDVEQTIKRVTGIEKIQAELKETKFQLSEQRAKIKYQDYDYVVQNFFIPVLESNPDIEKSFKDSHDPAEFAYQTGIAKNIPTIIEMVRKQTEEATRKSVMEEMQKKAGRTIPSLSAIGAGARPATTMSDLRKELDEL